MFQQNFAEIFAELDSIEIKLKSSQSEAEKEAYTERLLTLRRLMDQCIQSWLCFEERVNQLQDNHGLELPDEIPDMLFKNLGLEESELSSSTVDFNETQDSTSDSPVEMKEEIPEEARGSLMGKDASISSFKRGLGFYDLYMLEEAIKEFENLVSLEPNFLFGHFLLGYVYSHKKQYEDAEKEFRLVLALTKDPQLRGMAYNSLGSIYAERGKYEQALEEFHLAEENSQEIPEVSFNLAAAYYNLNRYHESIQYFEKAIEHFPDDWEIYFYISKGYQYLKNYGQAATIMETALRLDPYNPLVNFELGITYHLLNQREKAVAQYQKTLELKKEKKMRHKGVKNTSVN